MVLLASFENLKLSNKTALPDRLILIGQKLVKIANIKKLKCDILSNFQTLCPIEKFSIFKKSTKSTKS